MKSNNINETFNILESGPFIVKEQSKGFKVEWHPAILHALKQNRPNYFGSVDQVRKNAEVSVNAKCTHDSTIGFVHNVVQQSYHNDLRITPTLHILNYLMELI